MSAHTNYLFERRREIIDARETETVETAQDALDKARARYNTPEGSSQSCAVARAQARVDAARARSTK